LNYFNEKYPRTSGVFFCLELISLDPNLICRGMLGLSDIINIATQHKDGAGLEADRLPIRPTAETKRKGYPNALSTP
jgi:hypothetical protein